MKFLRQNSWLILLAVLVLVALILFICVITGGQEEAQQEPAETQKTSRYEKAYLCADSPSVSYLDENLEPAGTAVRGSEVTYSAENPQKRRRDVLPDVSGLAQIRLHRRDQSD